MVKSQFICGQRVVDDPPGTEPILMGLFFCWNLIRKG